MSRLIDWPERLAASIDSARDQPFTDTLCVEWAADVVLAITGRDPYPYRGMTLADAYRRMREDGHGSLGDALAANVGQTVPLAFARRGDVVLRADGDAVGVCCGQSTAFIAEGGGLAFLPTVEQREAYRV